MARRGWWLVGLNVLLPGSAQLLAGNRRWGRFALGATLILWGSMAAAAALYFLNRAAALTLITNVWVLWLLQLALLFFAGLWLITTLNALVLVRLVKTPGRTRGGLLVFTALTLAVSVGGTSYAAYLTGVGRDTLGSVFAGGGFVEPIDGRYTVLLLGGDAGPDRLGLRPDSITLASVDAASGEVTMIGIPRNLYNAPFADDSPLWADWPNGYNCGDDCLISYLYPYAEERPELYPQARLNGSTPGIEAISPSAPATSVTKMGQIRLAGVRFVSATMARILGVRRSRRRRVAGKGAMIGLAMGLPCCWWRLLDAGRGCGRALFLDRNPF